MSNFSKSVHIVNGNSAYSNMFRSRNWVHVADWRQANLIQFCGGADVNPALYGQSKHPTTEFNEERDKHEALMFRAALQNKIPMAGICRGGQFLNVMCGGSMWQNVDNHANTAGHLVYEINTGESLKATSTHHQMMDPADHAITLLVANESTKKENFIGGVIRSRYERGGDIEAVYYKEENCLCFQPHPEYNNHTDLTNLYFRYLNRLLEN